MKEFDGTSADTDVITTKQPKQLYLLFFAEMWERFSFYGMKALLIAYMTSQLNYDDPKAYAILGSYAALVYTMPMFGGFMADRFIGYQRAIIFGGILMTIGHLVLALPNDWSFFYGMAFIICGNGFFKPNISSLVGTLYSKNDPRRDSGFSIFYMGINIGAALGGALCAYVGTEINWHYGFGLAGIFMLIGLIVFVIGKKSLGERGLPPNDAALKKPVFGFIKTEWLIYGGTLIVVPLVVTLFHQYEVMDYIMFGLGIISLIYVLSIAMKLEREAKLKLFAALVMIIFSIVFWAVYEQNAGAMNLLAERNSKMTLLGMDLPELSVNNFLPPGWVIVLTLLVAPLWPWLNKRGKEPSTPLKFAISFIFLGIGFYVFYLGCLANESTGVIPLWPFVVGYMFIICGELCISPIGLSMVTKLSPVKIVSMMMGIWFFASAIGEFLAGKIGSLMSVPMEILDKNDPVLSLPYYADVIQKIGIASVIIGIILMFTVPLLKKWMKDIH
ncbi:MAG: peptide MFS transporter [Chitinophagaceae bacterium]|nr:peptide MFS transporter [Chitinophagaceae bacterium]